MRCPYCAITDSEVVETRVSEDFSSTRRRRECKSCGKRFTTYERVERAPMIVIKKDGRREQFSRDKLRSGVLKSTQKTTVTGAQIEAIVNDIEREVRNGDSIEVESTTIGQVVASKLKSLDKVAYIRFASVFRQFVDVEEFEKELKKLL